MRFAEPLRNERCKRHADRLALRPAEHLLCGGIEHHDVLALVDGNDRIHRRIDDAAQLRFASREQRFGAHAFGDIAQDDGEEFGAAVDVLRDRRLDRKFLAVRAEGAQCAQSAHPTRRRARGAEALDVLAMDMAEAFRNQPIQRLTDHRFARPSERALGSRIEQNDSLRLVDGDYGIHRRFDDEHPPRWCGFVLHARSVEIYASRKRPKKCPATEHRAVERFRQAADLGMMRKSGAPERRFGARLLQLDGPEEAGTIVV